MQKFALPPPARFAHNTAGMANAAPGGHSSHEEQVLGWIDKNGYAVRSDVDRLLNVSQTTANRILNRMIAEGMIYRDGSGRKIKYIKR